MAEEEIAVESKFKKTLLQTEKRIMDLEVSVSELTESVNGLTERLKEIDPKEFSAIKERMEELEDLIIVEQAGIMELKKMLEGFQEKAGVELVKEKLEEISLTKSKVEEIEKKLEDNVKKILEEIELKLKGFEEARSKLEGEISEISVTEKRHSEYLKGDIESIKNKLKEISEMKNKLESFSEEMINIKSKFGETLADFGKRVETMEKNFPALNKRLSEVEIHANKFYADFETLKPLIEKAQIIESIEKRISNIETVSSNLKEKVKNVDIISSELNEIKSKVTEEANRINAEFLKIENKIKDLELTSKEIDKLRSRLNEATSGLNELKVSLTKTVEKSEFEKIYRDLETFKPLVEKTKSIEKIETELNEVAKEIEKLNNEFSTLEGKLKEIERTPAEVSKFNVKLSELEGRLNGLDKKIKEAIAISSEAGKRIGSFEIDLKKLEEIDRRVNEVENFIQNLIGVISGRIEGLPKIKAAQIGERIAKIEEGVKKKLSELEENYKKKLEEIGSIVEKRIIQARAPVGAFTAQIDELIDRIIDLESKLAALEKIMKEKKGPIVLE